MQRIFALRFLATLQFELDFDEKRARQEGRLRVHPRFASKFLSTRRDLIVYLPPGYGQHNSRHPVLYLQDGQNLFDPSTAFGGRDWRVDSTADAMAARGEIQPPIVVGIYNTGVRRISEYTPTRDKRLRKGGKADRYAEMLVREIKPFIDHEYRTLKAAAHTAVGGSSLGGLVSLVAALAYARVFGGAAILSPSVWWDNYAILNLVNGFNSKLRPRLWVDTGTNEGNNPAEAIEGARALRQALLSKGWREGDNLAYKEILGGTHSEDAWASRFGSVLSFLFPKR
jgi:predicted alpha/beta superfamily hydrolase